MSFFKAIKNLGKASARVAMLPIDLALDSTGANILKERGSVSFTYDRLRSIGKDIGDAYEETK